MGQKLDEICSRAIELSNGGTEVNQIDVFVKKLITENYDQLCLEEYEEKLSDKKDEIESDLFLKVCNNTGLLDRALYMLELNKYQQ
jgi:hypothetical protein